MGIYFTSMLLLVGILVAAYFLHIAGGLILFLIGIVVFEIIEFIFSKAVVRSGTFEKPIT